ncbi:integrase [Erythrobacter sp. JL475]|nr:integrase [Erythrobacter sp. JL475]
MALGKQAKVLTSKQVDALLHYVGGLRNGVRNQVIVLLSTRAGLRAKEIASLRWSMILDADSNIGDAIHLTDEASKGNSGRVIPLNRQLRQALEELYEQQSKHIGFDAKIANVIWTERSNRTTAQVVVNQFWRWYQELGFVGCSSHSGRRTFITNAARKISTVGGSLRDVQMLAGHCSLQTTQRYIEGENDAKKRIVDLII